MDYQLDRRAFIAENRERHPDRRPFFRSGRIGTRSINLIAKCLVANEDKPERNRHAAPRTGDVIEHFSLLRSSVRAKLPAGPPLFFARCVSI